MAAFQVLSQSKVLTAALFGKVFRGRDYSSRQWFCLCAIACGIAICQLADIGVDTLEPPDLLGVATVMTTSLLGAAAGTYIEATLQRVLVMVSRGSARRRWPRTAASSPRAPRLGRTWTAFVFLLDGLSR